MIIKKIVSKNNDLISTLRDFGFSYSQASYLYHHLEFIKLNNQKLERYNLTVGDILEITLEEENKIYGKSSNHIKIIYEDEYFLVVDKPKNIATIPTKSHYENNLSSDIANYYLKNNIKSKIHILTRLDYETSGLVLLAKNQYIQNIMKNGKIDKFYSCMVHGIVNESGLIDSPILKDPTHYKRRIVSEKGQKSVTEYAVIKHIGNNTQLWIHLLTGRTHQIRVHLASISHPLIGDSLYGNDQEMDLSLICEEIHFTHPITNKLLKIKRK